MTKIFPGSGPDKVKYPILTKLKQKILVSIKLHISYLDGLNLYLFHVETRATFERN